MRLLLVEDERKISTYVKRGLEESGYAVDPAYTGQEALDWAEAASYDLIILDILLPVLMLTARDTIDDRVAGLDAGADDYLVKPFAIKELLARLRALTRRSSDHPKTPLMEFADLILDTRTRQVRRCGRTIDLASKEFAVLECLMREPERVLSRTQIAEHVWNYNTYNQSNVVDVYIRNLRRKIDDPYESKLIHTVRGAGYCLSLDEMD
jgi:DNA-binding response OmpR family regulator